MRPASLLVLALLAAGCGAQAPAPDLPEPWSGLALPVGAGEVKSAATDELHLRYDGRKATEVQEVYHEALVKAGYEGAEPFKMGGIVSQSFDRGSDRIELVITSKGSRVDLLLSR